jgi:SAM-dependent MidA family methyltransferase
MANEILEQGRPLSKSLLWKLQEDYFTQSGIAAWDEVPFYATSNPFHARAYAELIVGFLLDARDRLDPKQPLYVLEIGAGAGQFGFYVLRSLREQMQSFEALRRLDLRFVLTDIPEQNVAFWEKHEGFRELAEAGLADFAVFNPEREKELTLRRSKKKLAPGAVKNPLIVICNYIFDGLRQDVFKVAGGALFEGRVKLSRPARPKAAKGKKAAAARLDDIVIEQSFEEDAGDRYYGDSELDEILRHYRESLDEGGIIFPIGSFHALRNLEALGGGNLVLLASDKGFCHMDFMSGDVEHELTYHGSFSFMVNFDAIRRWFDARGGTVLHTDDDSLFLQTIMAIRLAKPGGPFETARYFFRESFGEQNVVNDVHNVQYLLPDMAETPQDKLEACIAMTRLSNYDPVAFARCEDVIDTALNELIEKAETDEEASGELDQLRRTIVELTDRVRQNFFFVNASGQTELDAIGAAYYALDKYDACRAVFRESLARFGPGAYAYYFIASTSELEEKYGEALENFEKALALDPACELSKAGLKRMKVQLRRV